MALHTSNCSLCVCCNALKLLPVSLRHLYLVLAPAAGTSTTCVSSQTAALYAACVDAAQTLNALLPGTTSTAATQQRANTCLSCSSQCMKSWWTLISMTQQQQDHRGRDRCAALLWLLLLSTTGCSWNPTRWYLAALSTHHVSVHWL
jgi:hypothetical protein